MYVIIIIIIIIKSQKTVERIKANELKITKKSKTQIKFRRKKKVKKSKNSTFSRNRNLLSHTLIGNGLNTQNEIIDEKEKRFI